MGSCASTLDDGVGAIVEKTDGGEEEFHSKFIEDDTLGQGEYGFVKKVLDKTSGSPPKSFACKYLKKRIQSKDIRLYSPKDLVGEIEMLRALRGDCYCLKLTHLYESPKHIMMVTEFCAGGKMVEWASGQEQDLRTEDVSRIAYQMLSAVNHCAKHNIIHRNIKAENVMFKDTQVSSDLRLIDFGSGTNRPSPACNPEYHTTFKGSAFYVSPEMFQGTYTSKTDVWSVGVTLYVLVAGYPADCLQKAFELIQSSQTDRNLRQLPNMPESMPETYYGMLNELLLYPHKLRKTAGEMLNNKFVRFSDDLLKDKEKEALEEEKGGISSSSNDERVDRLSALQGGLYKKSSNRSFRVRQSSLRKNSVFFSGSVGRHSAFLNYQKFERSLTTLLATVLRRHQFEQLVAILDERYDKVNNSKKHNRNNNKLPDTRTQHTENLDDDSTASSSYSNNEKLGVVQVYALKEILVNDIKNGDIIHMINSLKDVKLYNTFAYDISILKDFTTAARNPIGDMKAGSVHGRGVSGFIKGMGMANVGGDGDMNINSSHRPFGRMNISNINTSDVDASTKSLSAYHRAAGKVSA